MKEVTEIEKASRQFGISYDDDGVVNDPFMIVGGESEEGSLESEEELVEDDDVQTDEETSEEGTDEDSKPEEGEESDDDDDASLYYYIQQELKKDGFIDPDAEFDKKVDGMTVYNAYKNKIRTDIENEVRQQAVEALIAQGYNEEDLFMAQAIRSGFDTRLLNEASMYEVYSNMGEDTDYDDKISVITQMYRQRGFSDDETKSLIDVAEQNDKIDDYFSHARSFFSSKYSEFKESVKQREEQERQRVLQEAKNAENLINRVVTSQELYGEKLTQSQAKQINDSIRVASEMVEVEGVKHRVSELQKFIIDFQNDPEFRLYAFKLFKFRETDKETLKEEAKREVEDEFLKGYKKKIVKSETLQSKLNKLDQKQNSSRSYLLDFEK